MEMGGGVFSCNESKVEIASEARAADGKRSPLVAAGLGAAAEARVRFPTGGLGLVIGPRPRLPAAANFGLNPSLGFG
jgi:hypothetical protein